MPRSVQEIQNDIAKVKAEIALKNKYMNGYSAPTSNRGWGAYFQGDRSVHQKALDDQTAWARALQQQEFQASESDLNRALQEKLARINSDKPVVKSEADIKREAREKMRDQMELEQAQADYDAAMDALDSENPQTALAAQRAAIKLNYALRNVYPDTDNQGLASFFNAPDASLEDLIGRAYYVGKSSPRIETKKLVDSAVAYLDPLQGIPVDKWTEEQRTKANEAIDVLKKHAPNLVQKYNVEVMKKGDTSEERSAKWKKKRNELIKEREEAKAKGRKSLETWTKDHLEDIDTYKLNEG
jgi:hypothetical protein